MDRLEQAGRLEQAPHAPTATLNPARSARRLSPLLAPPRPPRRADVVEIEKSGDAFRLLYDTKGRFVLHEIAGAEKGYKLGRVVGDGMSAKNVPYIVTHDGRTIRFPDPLIKKADTVKIDLATGKVAEFVKFAAGNTIMVTKGRNTGRVGVLLDIESHPGSFDIAKVKDAEGNTFATRAGNVFVIGKGDDSKNALVSLPRGKGIVSTRGMRACATGKPESASR